MNGRKQMADALCLGEILVDWVCTKPGADLDQAEAFTKAAGGAPANTAVGLARQGISTAFIGRVSADAFGLWLRAVLESEGIDTSSMISDPDAQTRMAYVVTTETGDRKMAEFSKISCADERLTAADLQKEQFERAKVFHFGSISLIKNPSQQATKSAVELARRCGLLISYDPNVRIGLWPSADHCRNKILETLHWADLVKINEEELFFLTGSRDLSSAEKIRTEQGIALLIVTLDSRGSYFCHASGSQTVAGFDVRLLEATGAGDGFNAAVICGLLQTIGASSNRRQALEGLQLSDIKAILRRANAVGALTCTKAGAIPALPTVAEVDDFLQQQSRTPSTP
jgi:fructokinase